jgi:hypothetical protein
MCVTRDRKKSKNNCGMSLVFVSKLISQVSFTIEKLLIIIVYINTNSCYYVFQNSPQKKVFQNTCHFNKTIDCRVCIKVFLRKLNCMFAIDATAAFVASRYKL